MAREPARARHARAPDEGAETAKRARASTVDAVGAQYAASGRAADLDRLIHERMRLGIVSALAVNDALSFNDLKKLLGTSDGNLSVHALKLEDAGYIATTKGFDGRIPRTEYRLTEAGRAALDRYLDHMEALIRATRGR